MDFSLSIEQNKVILWAREIAAEIKKTALHPEFSAEQFEGKIIRLLAQNNLLCPTIPIEYGGLGLDRFTTALVIEEIAAGFPSAAAVVDATIHAAEPILLAGSRWQKEEYLPALTGVNAGTASFALTEAAGGSDLSLLQSSAVISAGQSLLP